MPKKKRSWINFDKTIKGVNVTERGPQSYSTRYRAKVPKWVPGSKLINAVIPLATVNVKKSGIRASIGLPGTGISKRNIKIKDF